MLMFFMLITERSRSPNVNPLFTLLSLQADAQTCYCIKLYGKLMNTVVILVFISKSWAHGNLVMVLIYGHTETRHKSRSGTKNCFI